MKPQGYPKAQLCVAFGCKTKVKAACGKFCTRHCACPKGQR